jgi:hypothetical protein
LSATLPVGVYHPMLHRQKSLSLSGSYFVPMILQATWKPSHVIEEVRRVTRLFSFLEELDFIEKRILAKIELFC